MCSQRVCPKCGEVIGAIVPQPPACEHCYCQRVEGSPTAGAPAHLVCCKCGDRRATYASGAIYVNVTGEFGSNCYRANGFDRNDPTLWFDRPVSGNTFETRSRQNTGG